MKKLMKILLSATVCAATFAASAAEEPEYMCSLRVGNQTAEQSTSEGSGAKKSGGRYTRTSVKTKTTSRSLSWPVTVSFTGKSLPAAGSVKLKCYFVGTTDGKKTMLGDKTIPVTLDEKGVFKTEVKSPTEKLVRTKTITTTRRRRHRGGGMSAKSETTGSRVTGCIMQLTVNGTVEKAFASNSKWSSFAKQSPLPEADILK